MTNVSIETFVGWIVTGVVIIGHIFVANYRLGQVEKAFEDLRRDDIHDLWEWKNVHIKEDDAKYREIDREITSLKVMNERVTAQFDAIIFRLTTIEGLLKK